MKPSFSKLMPTFLATLAGASIVSASPPALAYIDCGPAPSCTILGIKFCGCPWGDVETPEGTGTGAEGVVEACFDDGASLASFDEVLASYQPAGEREYDAFVGATLACSVV